MKDRWSGRSKYDFFNDIISHTDINSWQIEQQIDPLQLLLLNFPQVALSVQADLVLLYLAVQALLLPHAIRDLSLQFGNVVLAVDQLLLQQALLLRRLVLEQRHRLSALLLVLLDHHRHLRQRQFFQLELLLQFVASLLEDH